MPIFANVHPDPMDQPRVLPAIGSYHHPASVSGNTSYGLPTVAFSTSPRPTVLAASLSTRITDDVRASMRHSPTHRARGGKHTRQRDVIEARAQPGRVDVPTLRRRTAQDERAEAIATLSLVAPPPPQAELYLHARMPPPGVHVGNVWAQPAPQVTWDGDLAYSRVPDQRGTDQRALEKIKAERVRVGRSF